MIRTISLSAKSSKKSSAESIDGESTHFHSQCQILTIDMAWLLVSNVGKNVSPQLHWQNTFATDSRGSIHN